MLKSLGVADYHTFRLHYWDWRSEVQVNQDSIFMEHKIGVTLENAHGQPQVYGDLYGNGWDTVCWSGGSGNVVLPFGSICDPNEKTGPLLRCPFRGYDVCDRENPDWPTLAHANTAVGKPEYDTPLTSLEASFRYYVENGEFVSIEECARSALCHTCFSNQPSDCDVMKNDQQDLLQRLHSIVK